MPDFGPPEIAWVRLPDTTAPSTPTDAESGTPQPVIFRDLDGWAVFEGCILLGKSLDILDMRKMAETDPAALDGKGTLGFGIVGQKYRWRDGLVSYNHDAVDQAMQTIIAAAIDEWTSKTGLRFSRIGSENVDAILFQPGSICASYIGRQMGRQEILLAPGCSAGNVMHEIGHAIGLWHEHTRPDRDRRVEVKMSNVRAGARPNFYARSGDGVVLGDYDYKSIMHYPPNAFAIDPAKPTIVARDGQPIGQRKGLSVGDVAAVKALYP